MAQHFRNCHIFTFQIDELKLLYLTAPDDFTEVSSLLLVFDQSTTTVTVNISIVDDTVAEATETFQASLTLVDSLCPDIITISPSLADIFIEDSFGKHIHNQYHILRW